MELFPSGVYQQVELLKECIRKFRLGWSYSRSVSTSSGSDGATLSGSISAISESEGATSGDYHQVQVGMELVRRACLTTSSINGATPR